jgi:hypothetical protein
MVLTDLRRPPWWRVQRSAAAAAPLLLLLLLSVQHCCGMEEGFGGLPGMGENIKDEVKPKAFGSDIKYLKCPVCKAAAASLVDTVKIQRAADPQIRLGDEALIELVEKACNPHTDEGEWILSHDYLRTEDKTLQLTRHDSYGKCNRECETIQQACEAVVGAYDTDIADALYRQKSVEQLTALMCTEDGLGAPCQGKQKMKKARKTDENFEPISKEDHETAKLMRSMGDMGLGGQMFTPDMLSGMGAGGGAGGGGGFQDLGDLGGMGVGGGEEVTPTREGADDELADGIFGLPPFTEWPWFVQLTSIAAVVVLLVWAIVLPDEEASEVGQAVDKTEQKESAEAKKSE